MVGDTVIDSGQVVAQAEGSGYHYRFLRHCATVERIAQGHRISSRTQWRYSNALGSCSSTPQVSAAAAGGEGSAAAVTGYDASRNLGLGKWDDANVYTLGLGTSIAAGSCYGKGLGTGNEFLD